MADLGTSEAVAQALNISKRTVDRHLNNVHGKLAAKTTVECVTWGIRRGVIQ